MATLKSYHVEKDWGIRPTGNVIRHSGWYQVEKGEKYDLLQVACCELSLYINIGIPVNTSDAKAKEIALEVASKVSDKYIEFSNRFADRVKSWGCD